MRPALNYKRASWSCRAASGRRGLARRQSLERKLAARWLPFVTGLACSGIYFLYFIPEERWIGVLSVIPFPLVVASLLILMLSERRRGRKGRPET